MQVRGNPSRVRAAIALVGMIACSATSVTAQERGPEPGTQGTKRRFFGEPMDFWQRGLSFEPRKPEKVGPSSPEKAGSEAETEWGQVVRLPDGSMSYRELPKPLVQVLEDPNPENIRRYFEWRLSRAGKILRAAEAIREFRGESQEKESQGSPMKGAPVGRPPDVVPAEPPAPPATKGFTLLYFHREGCVHCQTQDAVFAQWLKKRPDVILEKIEYGMRPDLWAEYKVRGTPSIAIVPPGAKRGRFLEGLAREVVLDLAISELAKDVTGPTLVAEGTKHVASEK
jgi:hypothetical protein